MEAVPGLAMSMVGKLLEEVSWEHATSYRRGGRGRENVLTAEVMMALDFLPRHRFLGAAIRAAKGADHARNVLINEIEEAELRFLPGDMTLAPNRPGNDQLVVQPDALITSPSSLSSLRPSVLERDHSSPSSWQGNMWQRWRMQLRALL